MKRILFIFVLAACISVSLCACGVSEVLKTQIVQEDDDEETSAKKKAKIGIESTETDVQETEINEAEEEQTIATTAETEVSENLLVDEELADSLSKTDYVEKCETYSYKDLLSHNEDYKGKKIAVGLHVVNTADGQYLATSKDGDNYVIFDDRKSDKTRILVDDDITIYGDYDGTVTVSDIELPKILARYIDLSEEIKESEAGKYETMYVINCKKSITLRTEPNTKAAEIRQIPLGAAVSFIESAENGFYKVIYLSDTGYALASYLGSDPQETAPAAPEVKRYTYTPNTTLFVVNCNESITLRTIDSTSGTEICQIPLYAPVTYLEDANNGFYKVVYNGKTGYALASYLTW